MAELDTGASVPLVYPYPSDDDSLGWELDLQYLLRMNPVAGNELSGFGNLMRLRLIAEPEPIELEVPVYFVKGCHGPLVGLELLDTYFDVTARAGGLWELTLREDRRGARIALRADHLMPSASGPQS